VKPEILDTTEMWAALYSLADAAKNKAPEESRKVQKSCEDHLTEKKQPRKAVKGSGQLPALGLSGREAHGT